MVKNKYYFMSEIMISLKHVWEKAEQLATERHNQKKNFKSCLQLSPNYELVGILGEMTFSLLTQQKMDTELKLNGDNGYDFKNINIKTSEEHKAKHLIEFIDKEFNGYYIFIVINLEKKYGIVKGRIHSDKFKELADVKDFGYGNRLALSLDKLPKIKINKPLVLNNIYNE